MAITINGTTGITTPEVVMDNGAADGGQVVLKSSGYSNWNWDNYSGRLRAYYNVTEYFTIDTSGNVGIGTSSPAGKLHVSGQTRVADSSNAANYILIGSGANAPRGGNSVMAQTGSMVMGTEAASPVIFIANASESVRIDSSGILLVGTTTSAANNGGLSLFNNGGTSGRIDFSNKSGSSQNSCAFYYGTTPTLSGTITTNSTTVSYNTSSDYRLKEDIQPMTGALAKVVALKPCTYKWKADGSDGEGFIAHELAEVCPQAVTGEKDAVDENGNHVYQGIDTSFLVATLTAAIQEQQAIIQTLTDRIEALEAK